MTHLSPSDSLAKLVEFAWSDKPTSLTTIGTKRNENQNYKIYGETEL